MLSGTNDILFLLSQEPVAESLLSHLAPKDILVFHSSSKNCRSKINSYLQTLPKINATIKKEFASHQVALAKKSASCYRSFDSESKEILIDVTPTREERRTALDARPTQTLCSALLPQIIFMIAAFSLQEKLPGEFTIKMIGIGCASFGIGCMTFVCLQLRKICKVRRASNKASFFMKQAQKSLLEVTALEKKSSKNHLLKK